MSTLSKQQIDTLKKAKEELKLIECVIDEALSNKEKYEEIRDLIIKDAIAIAKPLKPYTKNLFNVGKRVRRRSIETPEKTHAWLMKNRIGNKMPPPEQPHDMCNDYGELYKFLSKAKNTVKSEKMAS
jgi:hypothetical protein